MKLELLPKEDNNGSEHIWSRPFNLTKENDKREKSHEQEWYKNIINNQSKQSI